VRFAVAIVSTILPWVLKRPFLSALLGYRFGRGSRIGFSVVAVTSCTMGDESIIGSLTTIRGLARLELADNATIGSLNSISGNAEHGLPLADSDVIAEAALIIGPHSAITNRHYLDCLGGIVIGSFTTVAGVRSQYLTHSINLEKNRQEVRPISIGSYCFLGTGCIVLSGARLPDYSVLGAGSVLRTAFQEPWTLYAGVPATAVKKISQAAKYFSRPAGYVQ
jgi:acetyltransferase-like isoleucine patch superfamily enzyme